MQETQRFVIERAKGSEAITARELAQAVQVMPNGWYVIGLENRSDGTTIVHLREQDRRSVVMPK